MLLGNRKSVFGVVKMPFYGESLVEMFVRCNARFLSGKNKQKKVYKPYP